MTSLSMKIALTRVKVLRVQAWLVLLNRGSHSLACKKLTLSEDFGFGETTFGGCYAMMMQLKSIRHTTAEPRF